MESALFPLQFLTTASVLLVMGWAISEAFFAKMPGYVSLASVLAASVPVVMLVLALQAANQVLWLGQGQWQGFVASLYWRSEAGMALKVKAMGLVIIGLAVSMRRLMHFGLIAGSAVSAFGFSLVGHSTQLNPTWGPILITAHVWIAAFWCGVFWPIVRALQQRPGAAALAFVEEFATAAMVLIPTLLLVGLWLMLALNGWPGAWAWNRYQWVLLAKVLGVLALLGFALYHRMVLTPRWRQALEREGEAQAAQALARSVRLEAWVMGAWVLLATAWITSMDGPPSAH